MLISVIIPSYRPKDYLFHCIDSLEQQSLSRSAYEIILVLNGCNEPYKQQIQEHLQAHSYENVCLLQTDVAGVSKARNIGLDEANGDYVTFVDDDDWMSSNYLEALLDISDHDTIACSNMSLVDEQTGKSLPYFLSSAYKRCQQLKKLTLFNSRSFLSTACGKLIPRTMIGEWRFDEQFTLGEDSLFMFGISNRIKDIQLAGADVVYYVRNRNNSASRSKYSYGYRVKIALQLTASYILLFLKNPLSYNIPLLGSRIFATLWKLRKKNYE